MAEITGRSLGEIRYTRAYANKGFHENNTDELSWILF